MIQLSFGFGALEAEFWRLLFVMTRIGAALAAAPFFGAGSVPPQVRVIAAGSLAVLVCAWMPVSAPLALFSLDGLMTVLGEVLIGLSLGFVLQIAFAAPVMAAEVVGGTMGMSMAVSVDPNSGAQSPALGQYFMVMVTLVFLALGGHLQWLALVVESYRTFPPGQVLFDAGLGAERMADIAGFAVTMFATAVAMALPVTLVLLIVQTITGVLGRSAPSLNLFALGLPAGVMAGLVAMIAAMPVVTDQLVDLSATAIAEARGLIAP